MQTPTARLLELLELLQTRPLTTGGEIADRLEIDRRTVRRYVAALQELGIPVEGQRGVGGGYRVRPGYRLPPLMLSDDEAVVVVLGLIAARRLGPRQRLRLGRRRAHEDPPRASRPAAPARGGARDDARLHGLAAAGAPVTGDTVLLLADAIRRGRRVRTAYRSFAGERTRRGAEPLRARRPRGPLVPRRVRPRPRGPAHVPGRPDALAPSARRCPLSQRPRASTRSST